MESVHEKLKADKKLIVTKYMELTAAEANKFWPVYEAYQQDLHKVDQRLSIYSRAMPQTIETTRSPTKRRRSCLTSGSPSTMTTPSAALRMFRR